jgi:hypothetical protein
VHLSLFLRDTIFATAAFHFARLLINQIAVGLAVKEGKSVKARVLSSTSPLDEQAKFTGEERLVKKVQPTLPHEMNYA